MDGPVGVYNLVTFIVAKTLRTLTTSPSSTSTIPSSSWHRAKQFAIIVQWNKWVGVAYAVGFFAFFGTTQEVRSIYRKLLTHQIAMFTAICSKHERGHTTISDIQFSPGPKTQDKTTTRPEAASVQPE